MSNIKVKPVQFNREHADEHNLFLAINESGLNFAGKTKEMWAELLEHEYSRKKCGSGLKEESTAE